jgi:serine/threonine protein kinase
MTPEPAICPRCAERTTRFDACEHCGGEVLLRDRYLLIGELGHGARGTVYRALDRASGETVAIKEVPFRKIDELKILELVDREIKLLRELRHPNVPRHIDDFIDGPNKHRSMWLVQELVEGESLEQEMRTRRYAERDVLGVLVGVLETLAYLHRLSPPVIHRDIKPGNIIRRPDGRLALVDFGSARDSIRAVAEGSTVAGTFGYMAPEQFHGDAFPATDMFGLGAVAIALLTRRDPSELVDPHRTMRWRDVVDVSPATRQLLEAMLEPDPRRRASDAAALCEHVKAIVHGRVATPRATTPSRPTTRSAADPIRELGDALEQLFDPLSRMLEPPRSTTPPPRPAPAHAYAMELRPPAPLARTGPNVATGVLFLAVLFFLAHILF